MNFYFKDYDFATVVLSTEDPAGKISSIGFLDDEKTKDCVRNHPEKILLALSDFFNSHDEIQEAVYWSTGSYKKSFSEFKGSKEKYLISKIRRKHLPELLKKADYKCQKCGKAKSLTIDHIIPLTRGGTNDLSNFQVLCRFCNSSKGNKLPNEIR